MGGGGGSGWDGCEQRIEAVVKIQKKKILFGGGVRRGGGRGRLGGGGGQGGCERIIEVFEKIQKKTLLIILYQLTQVSCL